jgi:hypothetical protein
MKNKIQIKDMCFNCNKIIDVCICDQPITDIQEYYNHIQSKTKVDTEEYRLYLKLKNKFSE